MIPVRNREKRATFRLLAVMASAMLIFVLGPFAVCQTAGETEGDPANPEDMADASAPEDVAGGGNAMDPAGSDDPPEQPATDPSTGEGDGTADGEGANEDPATAGSGPTATPPGESATAGAGTAAIPPVDTTFTTEPAFTVLEDIVAWVNKEYITQSDFEREKARQREALLRSNISEEERSRAFSNFDRKILDGMVDRQLVVQAGEEAGIRIPDYEVQMFIDNILEENPGLNSEEDLAKALEGIGRNLEQFKTESRQGIMMEKVRQRLIYPRVNISETEIREYYRLHQGEYRIPARVRLQEIFISSLGQDMAAAREEMDGILTRLQADDADFSEIATAESDSLSAESGGDLGEFEVDQLSESLKAVVTDLNAGEISAPIESESGLQIIRVAELSPAGFRPLLEVRDEITNALRRERRDVESAKFVEELREQAYIIIYPEELQ